MPVTHCIGEENKYFAFIFILIFHSNFNLFYCIFMLVYIFKIKFKIGTGELRALCVATWDTIVFTHVLSFFLSSPHPSLQPHTANSWKQKLLGSALVTERRSGKLSGSLLGPSIPLI